MKNVIPIEKVYFKDRVNVGISYEGDEIISCIVSYHSVLSLKSNQEFYPGQICVVCLEWFREEGLVRVFTVNKEKKYWNDKREVIFEIYVPYTNINSIEV